MTIDERLDRLSGIVSALAASVVHHDDLIEQISARMVTLVDRVDKLAGVGERHEEQIAELRRTAMNTERLLEVYLKRLPPQ